MSLVIGLDTVVVLAAILITMILSLTGLVLYYVATVYYDDTKTITDEEQEVLNVIEKHKMITQKEISNELDWSDAKISRVSASLESKDMVQKERNQTDIEITKISDE